MTKEKIFEELLAKRSAASQGSSNDDGSLDWQKTGGLDEEQLKIGKSPSHRGASLVEANLNRKSGSISIIKTCARKI